MESGRHRAPATRRRVLFTWELGQNSGHVLPALRLLQELRAQGCEVFVALREVQSLAVLLRSYGFVVLQAPAAADVLLRPSDPQPRSLADVLALVGFASPATLANLLAAWHDLFDLVHPDVVVASYAPLSLLLARLRGLRTALLAFPMELPTRQSPLPALRPGDPRPPTGADAVVVGSLREALRQAGPAAQPPIEAVHQLFDADIRVLTTLPEFDFVPRTMARDGPYVYAGATAPPDLLGAEPAAWPTAPGPRVFATLHARLPHIERIRQELRAAPFSTLLVLADASAQERQRWASPSLRVVSRRVGLQNALAHADALLCYAGHSTVCAAAVAGKPMVLVPRDFEQTMTALHAVRHGLAAVPRWDTPHPIATALASLLGDPRLARARTAFADRPRPASTQTMQRLAEHIAAL